MYTIDASEHVKRNEELRRIHAQGIRERRKAGKAYQLAFAAYVRACEEVENEPKIEIPPNEWLEFRMNANDCALRNAVRDAWLILLSARGRR